MQALSTLSTLVGFAAGQKLSDDDSGPMRRVQLGIVAALLSLLFAAIFGAAAGSSAVMLAIGNVIKVPVVVLLSTLFALPAGFLAWKLTGAKIRASDLLLTFGASVFAGTLVLAVVSPLVALYYHTSAWAGPALGIGSVFASLIIGTVLFVRGTCARVEHPGRRRSALLTAVIMVFMQVATLVQMVALASPILPEVTVFDGGIDRIVR